MIREIEYLELDGCIELTNGDVRLVVSTAFGPRVLAYSFDGGENVFGWHPAATVETRLGGWKPYGGHRLWIAPENMPLSYEPDNDPVEWTGQGDLSTTLRPVAGEQTLIQKEMTVTLDPSGTGVTLDHKLTNVGPAAREVSAWALTILRPGGKAIVPNEPARPYGPDNLLPVRSMAVWSYTDLTDHRWNFERDHIALQCDEALDRPQKFGVLNKQGWVEYRLPDVTFRKSFEHTEGSLYPDMNSNCEIYTAGGFIEVETLSPLKMLAPGESLEHREAWSLASPARTAA